MMTTNTHMRAGSSNAAGAGAPTGLAGAGTGPARGEDFLSTLAAALSIEGGASSRGDATVADVTPDDSGSTDAIDAIIAALSPIVPVPRDQLAAAGRGDGTAELPDEALLPGAAARNALPPSTQLSDLLRDAAGMNPDGEAAANAGGQSASRELPGQLLQTLGGAVREVAPEFRLAGGAEGITTTAAQAMASAASQLHGSTAAAGEHVLRSAVGSPRWAEELGSRLVMMTTRGNQEGSLTLSPEHLGPLEVRISINQNSAQVWFGAQHADTRAALAEALPRLREMFAEAGLSLGQAGVSHEAPRRPAQEHIDPSSAGPIEPAADAASLPATGTRTISSALLDLYA